MNGFLLLTTAVCVGASVIIIVLKTRRSRRARGFSDRDSRVFELHRKARLLGTIPSEHDLQRDPYERDQLSDFTDPEHDEVDDDARHFMFLDLDEEERERLEIEREEEELDELFEQLSIKQCVAHEIVEFHREEQTWVEPTDPVVVSERVAEALHLVRLLNAEFGWEPGQPRIADRMFNTNVMAEISKARDSQKVSFRFNKIVATMRSFARAAHVGRSELAKVMATRTLLGTGRMTKEEITSLRDARELFGDEFAEAAGYVDTLSRHEEIVKARKLGIAPGTPTKADLGGSNTEQIIELDRSEGRSISRSGRTLL